MVKRTMQKGRMRSLDTQGWMLAEAVDLLQSAERLQQQFFRIGATRGVPCWEPPVDMVSNGHRLMLMVALPGVPTDRFAVRVEHGAIIVQGQRASGARAAPGSVMRLEIPYGRFERRILLPHAQYRVIDMLLENGCLRIDMESTS
jgi:HSP20 family protein